MQESGYITNGNTPQPSESWVEEDGTWLHLMTALLCLSGYENTQLTTKSLKSYEYHAHSVSSFVKYIAWLWNVAI